jgi:ribosome-associated protein
MSIPAAVRDRFLARYARRISDRGELILSSQRYRDQARNVEDCLAKLRDLVLAVAAPPQVRKKSSPPVRAKENRLRNKRVRAEKKQQRKPPLPDM